MHQPSGPNDLPAKGGPDALVPQAYPENRDFPRKVRDQCTRNSGFLRRARAGGDNDALRPQSLYLFQSDLIVADDADLFPEFAEVLHQVIGKGVVIIDYQKHVGSPSTR